MNEVAEPPLARSATPGLATLNAAVVVVGILYFASPLLVPLALAALLAFVLAPAASFLQRARLGRTASVLIVVVLALAVIGSLGVVVGKQAASLAASLPAYRATIEEKLKSLSGEKEAIEHLGASAQAMLTGAPPVTALATGGAGPYVAAGATVEAPSVLVIARGVVLPLFGPLGTLGVVIIFLIFMLMAREDLRDRLVRLVGRQDLHRTILAMNDAAARLSKFFLIQLALNASFGVFIGAALYLAGLPNPALWGILAALMRFVPFLGTFIALAPPLLLALAVSPGWLLAGGVAALFLLGELVMGQVFEPLLYGQSTGLSPIAVIASASFWAFLWGPIGLILATPLTVCLVVIGRHVEALAFLEVALGDTPPLAPEETFYQRALEGNGRELEKQALRISVAGSLTDYYDNVAVRGLALAQADLSRDSLAFERLDAIHLHIETLLSRLEGKPSASAKLAGTAPPEEWRPAGSVLCVPARGQLDDLAATMAMQVLRGAGFGAATAANTILSDRSASGDCTKVRLCCLSVLEEGSNPSGIRYLLKRIGRQMPDAVIVVCLWHAGAESSMLSALRSDGKEEAIILSLGELLAFARAISARRSDVA